MSFRVFGSLSQRSFPRRSLVTQYPRFAEHPHVSINSLERVPRRNAEHAPGSSFHGKACRRL